MRSFHKVVLVAICISVSACAPGEVGSGPIQAGQWRPPISIGNGRYVLSGWDTEDAVNGGKATCAQIGRSFVAESIVPSTRREAATVTFHCQ